MKNRRRLTGTTDFTSLAANAIDDKSATAEYRRAAGPESAVLGRRPTDILAGHLLRPYGLADRLVTLLVFLSNHIPILDRGLQ